MRKATTVMTLVMALLISTMSMAFADSTVVPGQQTDDGSIPVGTVNGSYTSLYAWDGNGDFYWDLGDGRIQSTPGIDGIDDLDANTLTVCDYQVSYRGDFDGTPSLNDGRIHNNIKCSGYAYDGTQVFNSTYVHKTHPRYRDNLEPIWNTWGIVRDVVSGEGNLAAKGAQALIG